MLTPLVLTVDLTKSKLPKIIIDEIMTFKETKQYMLTIKTNEDNEFNDDQN